MDKLTDVLSTIFVSSEYKTKKKRKSDIKPNKYLILETEEEDETHVPRTTNKKIKQKVKKITREVEVQTVDEDFYSHVTEKELSEKLSEVQVQEVEKEQKELTEKQTEVQLQEIEKKELSEKQSEVELQEVEKKELSVKQSEVQEQELEKKEQNEKQSKVKSETKEKELTEVEENDTLTIESYKTSKESSESESDIESDEELVVKKYILKASEYYKKNIFVVNKEYKTNVEILSNLIHNLSLMNNVNKLYENSLYFVTSKNNKKIFKKMLEMNPLLYFTDIIFKEKINIDKSDKEVRCIYIIDFDHSIDNKKLVELSKKNVQLIILSSEYKKEIYKLYELFENRLLIHNVDETKNYEKKFFEKILSKTCKSLSDIQFNSYYDIVNDKKLKIRSMICKNEELRYS